MRVVGPPLHACRRINGDDAVGTRGVVERAVNDDGRGLEPGLAAAVRARRRIAGMGDPGHAKLRDVVAVDLRERRKAGAAGIVAVERPIVTH